MATGFLPVQRPPIPPMSPAPMDVGTGLVKATGSTTARSLAAWFADVVNAVARGADPTGVEDSTAVIQAAATAAAAAHKTLFIPPGSYRLTGAGLALTSIRGLLVSAYGATLVWQGNAGGTAVTISDCAMTVIEGLTVSVSSPYTLAAAVASLQDNALYVVAPTSNVFRDVSVIGNGQLTDAFVVTYTSGDANNDGHLWESVSASGYTRSAAYLDGLQSHLNMFRHVNFNGLNAAQTAPLGSYGIYAKAQGNSQGASFVVDGWAIGGHAVADYYLGGAAVNGAAIGNISSENSDRLLVTAAGLHSLNVTLRNVRFASNLLNADGVMIDYGAQGALTIIGSALGTNGTASTARPTIKLTSDFSVQARIIDTTFPWWPSGGGDDSTQFSPVTVSGASAADADVKLEGCNFVNSAVATQGAYVRNTTASGDWSMDAYFGETTHYVASASANTLQTINAAYPNQEIALVLENANTTIEHASGGTGSIVFPNGVDFTPSVTPFALRMKYDVAYGRWMVLSGGAFAPLASPTFTGTVTLSNGSQVGASGNGLLNAGLLANPTTNSTLSLYGKRNAGDAGTDVSLSSSATRTAGHVADVVNNGNLIAGVDWRGGLKAGKSDGSAIAGPAVYMDTAAPGSGTYARGDRVLNSSPSVGQPKGWICTVAGTPGTWVSEGNL